MFTKKFWRLAFERAAKSFGQGALLAVGADRLDVLHAHWSTVGGFAGGAAVLSILTSLASSRVGQSDDPSAIPATPERTHPR